MPHPRPSPTLAEMTAAFGRIGCLSFGGPAAQIGMLHRVVVEEGRWLEEERFLHALNYCMLLPGPEAQQLATYIGWLMHGVRGGIIAGLLFVLPGLVVILGLSSTYAVYQNTTWLVGLFFGLKAAVLAIVVQAVIRLARKTLKNLLLLSIAAMAFIGLFVFSLPFPLVVVLAAAAGLLDARRRGLYRQPEIPSGSVEPMKETSGFRSILVLLFWVMVWQAPLAALWLFSGPESLQVMFTFFSKMALVTFGGAYAVLAYVAQVAVQDYGWLKPGEMLDGLALAETTPGPLVLVLSFVGFIAGFRQAMEGSLIGGIAGALLVAWATFVPSFIWIFAGAPFIERLRENRGFAAALSAITAAVVGVILNLSIWFALHVLFRDVRTVVLWPALNLDLPLPVASSLDPFALLLFLLSAFLLFRTKVGLTAVLAICAFGGLAFRLSGAG